METTAGTFRKIDNLAAEARRSLQDGEERKVACGYLLAIQSSSQAALREALGDAEQQAMDYAAGRQE